MREAIFFRLFALFLLLVLLSSHVFPGALDPNFGTAGKFTISFPDSTTFYRSSGYSIYVQPSGRIVGGGSFSNIGPDGQAPGQYSAAYGLTAQPDGKILAIGVTANPAAANNTMWAIARYTDITNDQ
jgi:hypothetical protein